MLTWHALAKLRVQTERTRESLRLTTKDLGTEIRRFRDVTCPQFETYETPKEARQRQRRAAASTAAATLTPAKKLRSYNLQSYKFHVLDHYEEELDYGPTDVYCADLVCLPGVMIPGILINVDGFQGENSHVVTKEFFRRTNKNDPNSGVASIQQAQAETMRIAYRAGISTAALNPNVNALPFTPPGVHHHIALDEKAPRSLRMWTAEAPDDPANQVSRT